MIIAAPFSYLALFGPRRITVSTRSIKRRVRIVSVEELPVPDFLDPSPGMELYLTKKEMKQRIKAVIQILDATDWGGVVMYYWYDFSYERNLPGALAEHKRFEKPPPPQPAVSWRGNG